MNIMYAVLIGGLSGVSFLLVIYLAIRTYRTRREEKLGEVMRMASVTTRAPGPGPGAGPAEDTPGPGHYSLQLGHSPLGSGKQPPYVMEQVSPVSKDESPPVVGRPSPASAHHRHHQHYLQQQGAVYKKRQQQLRSHTLSTYSATSRQLTPAAAGGGGGRTGRAQQQQRHLAAGMRTWESTPSLIDRHGAGRTPAGPAGRVSFDDYSQEDENTDVMGRGMSASQSNLSSVESSATDLSSSGVGSAGILASVLEVSMRYDAVDMCLTVHVHGVERMCDNWQRKLVSQGTSYIKVSLFAGDKKVTKQIESPMKHKASTPSCKYDQFFQFYTYRLSDLQRFTLRFQFCVNQLKSLSRKKVLGEAYFELCQVTDWTIPYIEYTLPLGARKKRRRTSLTDFKQKFVQSPKPSSLGSLLVLLQYQPLAGRVKVFVRKGDRLAKLGHKVLPGSGDHYVMIRLMRDLEVVDKKETKAQSGESPTWNESFLFPIPYDAVNEHWLEFVVMLRGVHRVNVLGHVLIGPDTTPTGSDHWKEMLRPSAVDTAKWHNIIPTSSY